MQIRGQKKIRQDDASTLASRASQSQVHFMFFCPAAQFSEIGILCQFHTRYFVRFQIFQGSGIATGLHIVIIPFFQQRSR